MENNFMPEKRRIEFYRLIFRAMGRGLIKLMGSDA
jgi:hypothetical protein